MKALAKLLGRGAEEAGGQAGEEAGEEAVPVEQAGPVETDEEREARCVDTDIGHLTHIYCYPNTHPPINPPTVLYCSVLRVLSCRLLREERLRHLREAELVARTGSRTQKLRAGRLSILVPLLEKEKV